MDTIRLTQAEFDTLPTMEAALKVFSKHEEIEIIEEGGKCAD